MKRLQQATGSARSKSIGSSQISAAQRPQRMEKNARLSLEASPLYCRVGALGAVEGRPRLLVRLPNPNPPLPKLVRNRLSVEAESLTDRRERLAGFVATHRLADLVFRHAVSARREAVTIESSPHRRAMDTVLSGKVVHRAPSTVPVEDRGLEVGGEFLGWTRRALCCRGTIQAFRSCFL